MQLKTIIDEVGIHFSNASLVMGSSLIFCDGLEAAYSLNPFDPKLDFLQEEVTQRITRTAIDDGLDFRFKVKPVNVASINATVFPLSTMHPYNYFHFLIESLPDLLFFLKNKLINQESLILTGQLHRNMRDALSMVPGMHSIPMMQLKLLQQIDCRDIIAAPGAVHGTERIDGSLSSFSYRKEILCDFRDHFRKFWPDPAGQTGNRIYVVRSSGQRQLVNSPELEKIALMNGYVIVHPEKLDLARQIQLFSGASKIIGPTGAWLANLAFVREGAEVTVLSPQTCVTECSLWRGLGNIFNVHVRDVYCEIHLRNERQPIHSDFFCPADQFQALLA